MRKILFITGASGTLGNLLCKMLKKDYFIISIGRRELFFNIDENIVIDLEFLLNSNIIKEQIEEILKIKDYSEINLIHCAGVYQKYSFPIKNEKEFTRIFQIHCNSFMIIINALYPYWEKIRKGSILSISSNLVSRVNSNTLFYIATKGCLESMTHQLASDLGRIGVRCNSIEAGYFQSKIGSPSNINTIIKNTPLGRIGTPNDIAKVLQFLLKNDSYWINGEIIKCDGGNSNEF